MLITNRLNVILFFILLICPVVLWADNSISRDNYEAMLGQYRAIEDSFASNQYDAPISIKSTFHENAANGEVYALIDHEFALVVSTLSKANQWCDILLLHINVKGCENGSQDAVSNHMKVYVGRNYYQPPDEAYSMEYQFAVPSVSDNYVQVNISSPDGPFGTSDYLMTFEAIPFDKSTTFIHFKYAYEYGVMARLAINGYLATLGRHKVGFTVEDYDANNDPVYVKGLQGIVERNSMRYFIAIRSYLDTYTNNEKQWSARVDQWYNLAKRFNKQLIEVDERKYIETKRQEFTNREKFVKAQLTSDW